MANTRKSLEYALLRIEKGRPKIVDKKRKLTISSVAEEAGVTSQLVHVSYPDIADQIRLKTGNEVRKKRDEMQENLKAEKQQNKKLRGQIKTLRSQISMLTSVNETLNFEIDELKAILNSDNIITFKK